MSTLFRLLHRAASHNVKATAATTTARADRGGKFGHHQAVLLLLLGFAGELQRETDSRLRTARSESRPQAANCRHGYEAAAAAPANVGQAARQSQACAQCLVQCHPWQRRTLAVVAFACVCRHQFAGKFCGSRRREMTDLGVAACASRVIAAATCKPSRSTTTMIGAEEPVCRAALLALLSGEFQLVSQSGKSSRRKVRPRQREQSLIAPLICLPDCLQVFP